MSNCMSQNVLSLDDVPSAFMHPISQVTQLFVQKRIQANNNENIKAP